MSKPASRGRPPCTDTLTPSEWQVAEAVRHGMTNPGIARRLGVSVDAVKYHVANVLHKLGFASRKQLRLWPGVRADSSLFRQGSTMAQTQALGPIGQIARSVKDIEAARDWYGDRLGLRHLYSFGKLAFFDCSGLRLMLSEDGGGPAGSILYFYVDDIRAAHMALSGRDVAFVSAPHLVHRHADGTEEWMAFFKDNEDRPLAIMSQVKP